MTSKPPERVWLPDNDDWEWTQIRVTGQVDVEYVRADLARDVSPAMPENRRVQLELIREKVGDGYEKVSGRNPAEAAMLMLNDIHYLLSLPNAAVSPTIEGLEAALAELREMFPGSMCEIKAQRGNQSFDYVLVLVRSGQLQTPHSVSAKTLAEAMKKVRDWKEQQ